ncbi:MAG: hypothetical protein AAF629_06845 [Chloroflexota bacterium]
MSTDYKQVRGNLWVIDPVSYWRERTTRILRSAGYGVTFLPEYQIPSLLKADEALPDLTILGCTYVNKVEHKYIQHLLGQRHRLLILCASPSPAVMRLLFREGVWDIVPRSEESAKLLGTVQEVLQAIRDRDCYQAVQYRKELE